MSVRVGRRFGARAAAFGSILGALLFVGGCRAPEPQSPAQLGTQAAADANAVTDFKPQAPEQWQLSNGLTVFYLPDHELPLVKVGLYLRGGRLWEKKPGATDAMARQLRQGGAGRWSADAIDGRLDELASNISTSFTDEFGSVSFTAQSGDLDSVMEIFSSIILQPRFEQARFKLWQAHALDSIGRRTESPETVAALSLRPILFGPNSAQGRISTSKDITSLTRADLFAAYHQFVRPDGAILVITGDLSLERAKDLVQRSLSQWKPRGTSLGQPGLPGESAPVGVYFIKLPFQQATVMAGQVGIPRQTPDEFPIRVFNQMFGSGNFGSLLMLRIRAELGLVYGIGGFIDSGLVTGQNVITFQTKAESTGQALRESLLVLAGLQQKPVDKTILQNAKSSLMNSYIFKFGSPDAQANRVAALDLLGYPRNFDDTYLAKLAAVTPAEIQQVATTRWDLNKFRVVVVGNDTACRSLLTSLGDKPLDSFPVYRVKFSETIDPKVFVSASSAKGSSCSE